MDVETPTPRRDTWPEGYRGAVDFYLREDVSEALWEVAQRRRLHFYYHTDRDYRRRDASRTRVSLHCPRDVAALRETIRSATARVTDCGAPFYPFFTMATRANAPGAPNVVVGYDLSFECDLDLAGSFRVLAPLLGVLEHFGLPHLAKFSGQRSLHVIVPAEALAPAIDSDSLEEWSRAHARLGRLFCRLVPGITATWVGVAKQQPLSAAYSIHRYNGLVGMPLSLDQVLQFDPTSAKIDRFPGVSWRPEEWDEAGDGGTRLLELADESERQPERALGVAEAAFAGERWRRYVDAAGQGTPVEWAIHAGAPGLAHLPADVRTDPRLVDRLRRAITALDDPEVKTMRFQRLFAPEAHHIQPLAGRAEASRALAAWTESGLEGALGEIIADIQLPSRQAVGSALIPPLVDPPPRGATPHSGGRQTTPTGAEPILSLATERTVPAGQRTSGRALRAVRLFGLLPEPAEVKLHALGRRWREHSQPDDLGLFLALALGEVAPSAPGAVAILLTGTGAQDEDGGLRKTWGELVSAAEWRAEREPVKALAALGLALGASAVREWVARPDAAGRLALDGVFGGDVAKLAHAGVAVLSLRR